MTDHMNNREKLFRKLSKGLLLTAPVLVAGFGLSQAALSSESNRANPPAAEASAEAAPQAEGEAKAEGEAHHHKAKAEGEAEGEAHHHKAKAEGEAEGEAHHASAEGEARGEGEGEAEGEGEGDPKHVIRSRHSKKYKGGLRKAALVARGRELYDDASLSTNGLSCNSCHTDLEGYNETFRKRYSHYVAMGKDIYGKRRINAETMVQICMEQPMEAAPLAWDSENLAALTAYVKVVQKEYKKKPRAEGEARGEGEGEARKAKGEAEGGH